MQRPAQKFAFAILLVAAFWLRVVHNTHLLPPIHTYPNEVSKRNQALILPEEGFYHGSSMPSFLLNSLWLLYFPARAAHAAGQSLFPEFGPFALDLMTFYLWLGRAYMALFGTLCVAAVHVLGKRAHSTAAGWIAAVALALAPISVLGSRHMKEDMPLALFVTVALIFFLDVVQHGRRRDSMWAGAAAGMCMSAKWLGAVMIFPLLAAHWMRRSAERSGAAMAPPGNRPARIRWAMLFFFAGFYVLSPDYLIRPDTVYKGLLRGVEKSYTEHSDGMKISLMEQGFSDYFRTGLWPGLTPPLLALAAIGLAGLGRRRPREAWLLGSVIFCYYALLETALARPYPHYQRYLQPIIPALTALAAVGAAGLAAWLRSRRPFARLSETSALVAVTVLAALWPLHDTVRYLWNIPRSTIYRANEFLQAHVPPGSRVLDDNYGPELAALGYRIIDYRDKDYLQVGEFPSEESYVVFSQYGLGRYLEQPGANPEMTRFAHYIIGVGDLLADIRPNFRSFYCESPRIRIFHFKPDVTPFIPYEHTPYAGDE